jgi:hypothetical protein
MNQAGLSSILVAMALLAIGVIVVAQRPAKIPRIGFSQTRPSPPHRRSSHSSSAAVTLLEIKTLQRVTTPPAPELTDRS